MVVGSGMTWQRVSRLCSCGVASFNVKGSRCEGVGRTWGDSGGGCVCATAVTTMSQSANVAGLGLERRLTAWNLSYLTSSSSSVRFLFLALSFSCASRLLCPSLPNPCDVALLLLEVGFQQLLKAGIKSVELAPKQLLSKTGR